MVVELFEMRFVYKLCRLRFMPPASPRGWSGVNAHRDFKPVCPQVLPKNIIENETQALFYMTVGRLKYMKKLLPYLENQSEDCLYLNIYAPRQGK
jgi:neuroligin